MTKTNQKSQFYYFFSLKMTGFGRARTKTNIQSTPFLFVSREALIIVRILLYDTTFSSHFAHKAKQIGLLVCWFT